MKTPHTTRTTLLSAFTLFAVSLAGSGQAINILPSLSPGDAASHNDSRHYAQHVAAQTSTLEQVLEPYSFTGMDPATAFVQHYAMGEQLAGRGLSKTGRSFADGQQIDTWYSAAEDRSVVCVAWAEDGRHSQSAYVMPGKIRRSDVVPLP